MEIFINGKLTADSDCIKLTKEELKFDGVFLVDPGFGSGFPAYRYEVKIPLKGVNKIELELKQMDYVPVRILVDSQEIEVNKTKTTGGI